MNEPADLHGPRWFARPIVWLCGGGLLLMLLAMAVWWGARTGVRAMQSHGAHIQWGISETAYWVEEHLGISTDVWMWDGNVVSLEIGTDGTDQSDFDDAKLLELRRFPKLNWLILDGVPVTDAGIAELVDTGGLRQLDTLYLFDCHAITGQSLMKLSRLPDVEKLGIYSSAIVVKGADLAGFTNLQSLDTNTIPMTNADLEVISQLPRLTSLSLVDSTVDDEGLIALAHCPQLVLLDLSGSNVTDEGAMQILMLCPSVADLILQETQITDACLSMFDQFPQLSGLDLRGSRVTDAGVVQIAKHCPNLTSLYLDSTEVTDACLSVVEHLPNLNVLSVTSTAVTEAAVKQFTTAHPEILVTADVESEE